MRPKQLLVLDDPILNRLRLAAESSGNGATPAVVVADDPVRVRAGLDRARADGRPVIVVSTALVYGAWTTNAVPLTEDAPLRPRPELPPAVTAAEVERLVAEWRDEHPGTPVAVLRPTVTVADGRPGWLAGGVGAARRLRGADEQPPAQYLHVDDLAGAVRVVAAARLDGVFNVAPDGWMSGEEVRALAGGPRLRLPERLATRLAVFRWRVRPGAAPPGIMAYAVHPWVVANDRMRAAGWSPGHTNAEAFVASHRPGPLATLSPRRRQELALGAAAVALAGAAAAVVVFVRRRVARSRGATSRRE